MGILSYSKKQFYHDIIESIAAALDAKDSYTADHSRRVGDMAQWMCTLMGLKRAESEIIHMAAHVHDIGKIGIPDSVLHKKGPLSEEEWALLTRHPEIGAGILCRSQILREMSDIVLCHHERWDGGGYPRGLVGTDIPLGARIIAVCDSVDAMLSARLYRASLTGEECRQEIERGSGTAYDPAIVACTLTNWDSLMAIRT